MADLRDQITDLTRRAGDLALKHYRKTGFELKSDGSVVTVADEEVEDFLRPRVGEIIPDSAYLGEETVSDANAIEQARGSQWVWVVDPIDGTAAFTQGLDTFCISVGLFRNHEPHTGCVFFPALGHLYYAESGAGVFYDDERVEVLDEMPVLDRACLYVSSGAHQKYRITFSGKVRAMGSTALHYCLVARGAAVGAISTGHVWDMAAAAAAIKEAGGVMKHLDGRPIEWAKWYTGEGLRPAVLAAPPSIWDHVAETIEPFGERDD